MRNLFDSGKLLLLDLASTIFFLIAYLLTKNVPLSVALGMALGIAQIGWQLARKSHIGTMQWLSLCLVVGLGGVTLLTDDPRFVMAKPSLIYGVVGIVMLKRGWMKRYMPPVVLEVMPDVVGVFEFVWSGLMFLSAALNVIVVMNFSILTWASFMSIYGIVSKLGLFFIQYAIMRYVGFRRRPGLLQASP